MCAANVSAAPPVGMCAANVSAAHPSPRRGVCGQRCGRTHNLWCGSCDPAMESGLAIVGREHGFLDRSLASVKSSLWVLVGHGVDHCLPQHSIFQTLRTHSRPCELTGWRSPSLTRLSVVPWTCGGCVDMWGDVEICGDMCGYVGRCVELWELWGYVGICGEM